MEKKRIEKIPFMCVDGKKMAAVVIEGKRHKTLIIDFAAGGGYLHSALRREAARFCLTDREYAVYWPNSGRWQELSLQALLDGGPDRWYWRKPEEDIPPADRETAQVILGFLGKSLSGRKYARIWKEPVEEACARIKRETNERAEARREERLRERGDSLYPVPRGFEYFAERIARGEPTFTWWPYEDGTKSNGRGVCSACGEERILPKADIPRSKKKIICPACGKKAVVRKSDYEKKDTERTVTKEVSFIQRTKRGGLVIRYFYASAVRTARGSRLDSLDEYARDFLDPRTGRIQTDYYLRSNWSGETFWSDRNLTYAPIQYGRGAFYTRSLRKGIFEGTVWQYCQLETLIRKEPSVRPVAYLRAYLQRPELELLVKGGLTKLAAYYGDWPVYSLKAEGRVWERLNMSEAVFRAVKDHDPSYEEVSWFRRAEKRGEYIDMGLARWAEKHKFHPSVWCASGFLLEHMTLSACRTYVRKQARKDRMPQSQVVRDWFDYLDMAQELGMDRTFATIMRPKDLFSAHNDAADRVALKRAKEAAEEAARQARAETEYKARRAREEAERAARAAEERRIREERYRALYPNIEGVYARVAGKYAYSNGEVCIVVPKTASEVIEDGRMLRHCVGSSPERYLARINGETTYILFLRRASAPEKPWVTLEVEPGGAIEQSRTVGNTYFDLEKEGLGDFVDEWQEHIAGAMDEADEALATQSQVFRAVNLRDLRQRDERVRGGREQGQLLADVLESSLRETADGEKEARLIMSAFSYELLPVAEMEEAEEAGAAAREAAG